jgi:Zn-dependent peptidase ImmA (M78 family)
MGERLKIARSNAGFTQEDAAGVIEVSRPTFVAIEQGQRKIRKTELSRLAAYYKISVNDLLRSSSIHVDLVAKFRKGGLSSQSSSSEEAIQLLNKLASSTVELEMQLGEKQQFNPLPEKTIRSGLLEEQAEDLALEVRYRLGLGLSPITDLASLVEIELGVRLYFRPLASSISGVFAYDASVGPCMLVNAKHPRERQIHTIAHELGHYMCARNSPSVVHFNAIEESREERFVSLFATSFLMPATAIRSRFTDYSTGGKFTPRNLLLLAHSFGVSFEAMTRRLEKLQLLKQGTFDSIKERGFAIENSKKTLGLQSPPQLVSSPRLTLMAVEAFKRGLFSEGQLCNMLAIGRVQLREQIENFGGDSLDDSHAFNS